MPKLLSRSKHEEFESNSTSRSETKRKEEQKTEENEAQQILVTTCEIAPARHCSHLSTDHLHFTLLLFLFNFLCFFPFCPCNSF